MQKMSFTCSGNGIPGHHYEDFFLSYDRKTILSLQEIFLFSKIADDFSGKNFRQNKFILRNSGIICSVVYHLT